MAPKKNKKAPLDTQPRPVKKRFIVRSAEEAVTQVREVLGPDAKVISVRQVTGSGLQRFLAAPRLEIIAQGSDSPPVERHIQPAAKKKVETKDKPAPSGSPASDDGTASERAAVTPEEPEQERQSRQTSAEVSSAAQPKKTPEPAVSDIERRLKAPTFKDMKCGEYLGRAGFSEQVMSRLASREQWRTICDMPLQEGLTKAISYLREDRQRRAQPELDQRVAFVGGAGSGKTTALCKLLARDTFLRDLSPQVLRIETDKPHMDDGLPLYCDVLGLRCCRSEADLDAGSDSPIYVDVPGYSMDDRNELSRVKEVLDDLHTTSRVLVMNGAYESQVLRRFLETGDYLGARFQVISHVDELVAFGKLWEHLFDTNRHLLFFSNGQNVASDLIEDTFGFLLERTFPR